MANLTDADVLGAGATYFGDVFTVSGYSHIAGFAYSDVDSATPDGIIIEQGSDRDDFPAASVGSANLTVSSTAITGGNITDNALQVQIVAPFARIVYVNGAAGQGAFRMFFAAKLIRGL